MRCVLQLCCAGLCTLALTGGAMGGAITLSNSAPVPDADDISNLTPTLTEANVNNGDFNSVYIFSDRPAQGQTFITGSNPGGYTLDAVTVQHRPSQFSNAYEGNPLVLRIVQPDASDATDIDPPLVTDPGTLPDTTGYFGSNGTYITFNLAAPVTLLPNTVYGFDFAAPEGARTNGFELAGSNADTFSGGTAYSSGGSGAGGATALYRTGDREFVVTLTAVPEPASLALGLSAGLLLLRRTRGICR